MRKGLFRQEAIAAQGLRLHGEVMMTPSLKVFICCVVIGVWVAMVFIYLSSQSYSRQATVTGWLEPDSGVVRVFAGQTSGIISQVLVSDGERVTRGQPLAIIDTQTSLSSGVSAQQSLAAEYQTQQLMLEQQVAHARKRYEHELQAHQQSVHAMNEDIKQLSALLVTASDRLALVSRRYNKLLPLAGSHISGSEIEAVYAELLQVKQSRQELERQLSNLQLSLEQKQTAFTTQQITRDESLAVLTSRISEVKQKITQLESQSQYIVRARDAGIIANLNARRGQHISTREPLLTLLAPDAQIEAHFVVPVRSAGFIRHGQTLDIRYDAFPYQKFGMHQATVHRVSDTALLPAEFDYLPVSVNEPVYLAKATLTSDTLVAYGKKISLRSGMTFSADVNLSERTLLEWLLEPLYSITGRMA